MHYPMSPTTILGLLILSLISTGAADADVVTNTHDDIVQCDEQEQVVDDMVLLQTVQTQMKVKASQLSNVRVSAHDHGALVRSAQDPATTTDAAQADPDLAAQAGLTLNSEGDLSFLLAGITFNVECIIFFLLCFVIEQYFFPQILSFRATGAYLEGQAKVKAQNAPFTWEAGEFSFWKWIYYSFAYSREQLIDTCGLDAAMLIAFTDMCMEVLAVIGIPLLFIVSPIYCFLGGDAAGKDYLSYLGIGNVVEDSWIFWPVACTTWFVVIFTQWRLFQWMRTFIKYREAWLASMPSPQDTTILVEGIPDEYCSDATLKKYFQTIFGDRTVKSAFVVKKIASLESMVEKYKTADRRLQEVLFKMKKPDANVEKLESDKSYYEEELKTLKVTIKQEQERVALEAKKDPADTDIYATNGFVTFTDRKTAEQAKLMRLTASEDVFVISNPPEPADVAYGDLEESVAGRVVFQYLGYASVAGLFLGYLPIVVAISQAANITTLENKYAWFKDFTDSLGSSRETLASVLASFGLTFMTAMLPTFLMWIFDVFYTLKADRFMQLELQTYYFWFLILFVLLITSVGTNLTAFLATISTSPLEIFSILAEQMPLTTHFYMNYVVLQWATHGMGMMRYVPLAKYAIFKRLAEPEDARQMSEPEDQDYYGMGSRSARFTLMFVMGLVFSSICPLMALFTFINFLCCRVFYGYLIPYAETRKSDLGGDHFALQLVHVHLGLLIYIVLMTGVMFQRAGSYGPGIIAALSFVWWALSFKKFRTQLRWETLPYQDVVLMKADTPKRKSSALEYQQSALDPKVLTNINADPF